MRKNRRFSGNFTQNLPLLDKIITFLVWSVNNKNKTHLIKSAIKPLDIKNKNTIIDAKG